MGTSNKSDQQPKFAFRAVAYYRHSAQDRQENSIEIQQDQIRPWAQSRSGEIIHEFMDPGKSGLTAEGRPGFQDMMENWVKKRNDFKYILCLDVSRWGRFQDIDLSAQYSAECRKYGKEVIYTRSACRGRMIRSTRSISSLNDSVPLNTAANSATRCFAAA